MVDGFYSSLTGIALRPGSRCSVCVRAVNDAGVASPEACSLPIVTGRSGVKIQPHVNTTVFLSPVERTSFAEVASGTKHPHHWCCK
jgi:hypothetical protein